ncbi:hypothetical protein GCM10023205_50510 [Yinghuangia aomiensis]|uniref:Uncharacterized protein n=1 Tax=Yinghuangia aomiensis TaxID=676205 RepID=A0ABP9HS04_9ACTN
MPIRARRSPLSTAEAASVAGAEGAEGVEGAVKGSACSAIEAPVAGVTVDARSSDIAEEAWSAAMGVPLPGDVAQVRRRGRGAPELPRNRAEVGMRGPMSRTPP